MQNDHESTDRISEELRQLAEVMERGFDAIQSDIRRIIERDAQNGSQR